MKRSAIANSSRADKVLTRTVKVLFSDVDILTIVVSTPALQRSLGLFNAFLATTDDDADIEVAQLELARILAPVIVSWDLFDEDDVTVLEPTVENLADFNLTEMLVLMTALVEDLQADAEAQSGKARTSGSSKPSTKQAGTRRKS